MKLMSIIGARPQFIKAAPFSRTFRQHHTEILVHTGQHYDENMSAVFFEELNIPTPDYNLNVGSGGHGVQTGRMLEKLETLMLEVKPDGVLVYGDTNSTLAGALSAAKLHIPVFHAEAGLRSYNKQMPEEQNRVLTDHISDLLFCPTQTAVDNLDKEGVSAGVLFTGDIMLDAVKYNLNLSKQRYGCGVGRSILGKEAEKLKTGKYYLATVHRAENTDDPQKLCEIIRAFSQLDMPVLLPLHPRTRKMLASLDVSMDNIIVTEPVGYLLMLSLTDEAAMVLTDSGGLQKEAFFLQTPCTTLRDQTEWVETLADGWNVLSAINNEEIIHFAQRPLTCLSQQQSALFGDGQAAQNMTDAIVRFLSDL